MKSTLIRWLGRTPRLKRILVSIYRKVLPSSSVSSNYNSIPVDHLDAEGARLRESWKSSLLPLRQRELAEKQIAAYREGSRIDVFDVFVEAVRTVVSDGCSGGSLLEVGCSSGFYSEVVEIARLPFSYAGCDYSDAFIELGRSCYPGLPLSVGDATQLGYADESFDVVVSGGCLLHIPDYARAIAETARVARSYAVFHRTPVITGLANQYYRKLAYGVETIEIHFNEDELLAVFARSGLEVLRILPQTGTIAVDGATDSACRTYVCRKASVSG
jgi:SAM-dependent methyltransferase